MKTDRMDFSKLYSTYSFEPLVSIIECKQDEYTNEAIEAAKLTLKRKGVDDGDIRSVAREILSKRIVEYLNDFDVVNDTLKLPQSRILNEEEVRLLFQNVFAQWKAESDDMIPDGWKYAIGAGFG
jgi:hypothetical protein